MANILNPYFNSKGYTSERELIADLVEEEIQFAGIEAYYIPRINSNYDKILGEDTKVQFGTAIGIEVYLEDHSAPRGMSETLTKFGLEIRDSYNLSVSPRRFKDVTGLVFPQEGSLFFIDLKQGTENTFILLEIKWSENEKPHYQLGRTNFWTMDCEMFRHNGEVFNTGIALLDNYIKLIGTNKTAFRLQDTQGNDILLAGGGYLIQSSAWHNEDQNNSYGNNDELQTEAKTIVEDWDTTNPFGNF